jgi:hypothetical protein
LHLEVACTYSALVLTKTQFHSLTEKQETKTNCIVVIL